MAVQQEGFEFVEINDDIVNRLVITVAAKDPSLLHSGEAEDAAIQTAKREYGFSRPALEPQFTGGMRHEEEEDGETLFLSEIVITDQ